MYDEQAVQSQKEQIEQLEHRNKYHKVDDAMTQMKMERLRADAIQLLISVVSNTPRSREQSIAIHQIEDGLMWAIKALVVN